MGWSAAPVAESITLVLSSVVSVVLVGLLQEKTSATAGKMASIHNDRWLMKRKFIAINFLSYKSVTTKLQKPYPLISIICFCFKKYALITISGELGKFVIISGKQESVSFFLPLAAFCSGIPVSNKILLQLYLFLKKLYK
jgi:hypothetical protein